MKKSVILFNLIFFGALPMYAQEISGNLRFKSTKSAAAYATVDVYQGGKMISTILTDSEGNFNIKLDTGGYRLVFNYADCKPLEKKYNLNGKAVNDELEINDADRSKKLEEREIAMVNSANKRKSQKGIYSFGTGTGIGGSAEISETPDISRMDEIILDKAIASSPGHEKPMASSGMLTGGEVNDYAKLNMWLDLTETQMKAHRGIWNIEPQERYVLMLQTLGGIPLADAQVSLIGSHGKTVYRARTDNSGKAELWTAIGTENIDKNIRYHMEINYRGKKQQLKSAKPFKEGMNIVEMKTDCEANKTVDIAFVVDATGSMNDEINYLKEELNEIIFQSKRINQDLNYRYASVFYRDRGDDYLVHQLPFTRIVSESSDFINMHEAAGGGDYEEAVEIALDSAINKLSWSKEARTRILFLVMDAPPHATAQNIEKLEQLTRTAAMKGIRIIPIAASGTNKSTEYLMRCMALATNGTYLFLSNHSGIGDPHMAPSTDDYKVEKVNEMLKRVLTAFTYMPDCNQRIPDLELPYSDSLIQVQQTPAVDSLNPTADQLSWSFYPNPTFGLINVKANFDIPELYLTDLSGKILQVITHIQSGEVRRIDLSNYASGIYLLRYPTEKRMFTGKIMLLREG